MNEHLGEDAELYALGDLEEDERARIEDHAAACADCAARLGEAEAVVAELALSYATARPGRRSAPGLSRGLATAAALALAIGVTLASLLQSARLQADLRSNDAILATIATSHFNHVQFAPAAAGAPAAKLLNARHGEWLFAILDAPDGDVHVVVLRGGTSTDLGAMRVQGRTATLFVRAPGKVDRVELRRDGTLVESAQPSYRDE